MGSLTPGATYVYERADGVIYAREMGKTERKVIGYDLDSYQTHKRELSEWNDILIASEKNATLREALERVKLLYYLSKEKDGA